jgi:hypothetical protein
MSRFGVLVLLSLAAALGPSSAAALPKAVPADPALDAVPTDALYFLSVKLSKLWDDPAAKPVRDWLATQKVGPLDRAIGLRPGEIDRVTIFSTAADRGLGGQPVAIVTTRKPYDEAAVLKALGVEKPPFRPKGGGPVKSYPINGPFEWVVFVDETTLLYLGDLDPRRFGPDLLARLIVRKADGPLAPALGQAREHDVIAGLNVRALRAAARGGFEGDDAFAPFEPLLRATSATLTADFGKTARVRCTFHFADADDVKWGIKGLQDAIRLFETQLAESREFRDLEVGKHAVGWAVKLLRAAKVERDGRDLLATADVPYADDLAKFAAALPKDYVTYVNETGTINNLKQLGIAMHNHHDAMGFMPGDVVNFNNRPAAWSWRVQILPYVEQDQIYRKLNLMKPWNDPQNLKVLQSIEMPKVFEVPGRPAPKGHTYFRIFTLPRGAKGVDRPLLAEGQRGPVMTAITDGTSLSLMIVEAREAVPWYAPDVLAYDGKLPLPELGAKDADKFFAALCDGSARAFRPGRLGEKTLRAMITIQGGEIVEFPR